MKRKTIIVTAIGVLLGLACAVFVHEGLSGDREMSIDELKLYAHQGNLDAQNKLGAAYFNGKGTAKNVAEAHRWFRESAEKGYAKSQYNLAVMYYLGQGVAKDNAEAALWFKKAADQGIADAQYNLGVLHYQGTGVKQDYAEAFRLYSLSAEKGYALAQYNLGLMYLQGAGVPKDPVRAYIWLDLASGHKIPGAVKSLDYLGKTMTPEQLAEAKELMGDWKPK